MRPREVVSRDIPRDFERVKDKNSGEEGKNVSKKKQVISKPKKKNKILIFNSEDQYIRRVLN